MWGVPDVEEGGREHCTARAASRPNPPTAPPLPAPGVQWLAACSKRCRTPPSLLVPASLPHVLRAQNGWTPLHNAVMHRLPETVRGLLEKGANIWARTSVSKRAAAGGRELCAHAHQQLTHRVRLLTVFLAGASCLFPGMTLPHVTCAAKTVLVACEAHPTLPCQPARCCQHPAPPPPSSNATPTQPLLSSPTRPCHCRCLLQLRPRQYGMTALFVMASKEGEQVRHVARVLQPLLAAGAHIDARDLVSQTCLLCAAAPAPTAPWAGKRGFGAGGA